MKLIKKDQWDLPHVAGIRLSFEMSALVLDDVSLVTDWGRAPWSVIGDALTDEIR